MRAATTRVIAQSILDGRFLHWDLPVSDLEVTWSLSAPTRIAGAIDPESLDLADSGIEAWGTWLHVEDSGLIRASGILQPAQADGEKLSIEALGPSAYAARVPYRAQYSRVQVDPADVVRHLWAHIQSQPRGNLELQVHGTTPVRIGTDQAAAASTTDTDDTTSTPDSGSTGPYTLDWWDSTLCGQEINSLAGETPFDYLERAQWNPARTGVEQHIDISYPRAGTRRPDLRIAQGENVIESAAIEEPDDTYADTVYVHGRGEGPDAVTGYAAAPVGGRLRLPVVVVDKTIAAPRRARARAGAELATRRAALVEVPEVAVHAHHPNAPIGSVRPGDEVLVQLVLPWVGDFRAWHRVLGVRYVEASEAMVLTLSRRYEFAGN